MNLLKCLLIENNCFKSGQKIAPKGVMVHSTGANNPTLCRYVQPVYGQENYNELKKLLGRNIYNNHWNTPNPGGQSVCVHGFIGMLADGTVASVQTLPWDMRGWHCAGAANNTHISFEICEDALKDPEYFSDVYKEAAELTAHLCKLYDLNPLADGVVICHKEGARRGWASDHVDVEHWFPKFGKTMDNFRMDVKILMDENSSKEEDNVTRYNTLAEIKVGAPWAVETVRKLIDRKIIVGGGKKDANDDPADMELTHDMLRLLCFMDRAGAFDK